MKHIRLRLLALVFFSLIIFNGCGGNNSVTRQTATNAQMVSISIRLKVPDYINNSSFHAFVVDPATTTIVIDVSGPDIGPIQETRNVLFTLEDDGYYYTDCTIEVPVGISRQFTITTKDASGNILTVGSTVQDIDLGRDNRIWISLVPFEPTSIPVNGIESNTVEYGRTKYYRIDMSSTELCEITLQSPSDVRLLIFDAGGLFDYHNTYNWGPSKGITAVIDNIYGFENTFYIGVLGNQEGVSSSYTLTSKEVIGTPFEANFQCFEDLEPQAIFPSIASTGTELDFTGSDGFIDNYFIEIPIDFEFNYHGMNCDRVFVSPFGAISLLPFEDGNISFSSGSLGRPTLPNDLIAFFIGWSDYNVSGQVFYELKSSPEGRELIVEYRSIKMMSPLGPQTISGQIVLCESPDPTSDPIKFLYDRDYCNITKNGSTIIGRIGIENENGSQTRGPSGNIDVTELPDKDLIFEKR